MSDEKKPDETTEAEAEGPTELAEEVEDKETEEKPAEE